MTFAEYNTDENFENNESTLEELVRIGKSEGMTKDAIKAALSPKWQKSTKLSKFDEYYGEDIPSPTPFKEDAQTKAKATQNAINDVVKKQQSNIKDSDKEFLEQTNAIADEVEQTERAKAAEGSDDRWENVYNQIEKAGEGYKKIDDKMIANIPTFIWDRYKNGEFGKPGTSEAKNRLAYFVLNGFQNSLKVLSNGLMQMGGRSPMFADTTSDWEKFQSTNMAKGMENRWRKYEAETQGAIDLLKKQGTEEQDIMNGIAKIATNNRLQTAFNMMNENQKAYLIQVTEAIGDKIGSFNNEKLINFLIGSVVSDNKLSWQEVAEIAIAKFGKDVFSGDYKEKADELTNNVKEQVAGIGGSGNLKNYETIDGEQISFKMFETKDGKQKIIDEANKLSQKYYDGEIDVETFKKYYEPLFQEGKKHTGTKLVSADELLKTNNENKFKEIKEKLKKLNEDVKGGGISPSQYEDKYKTIYDEAVKWSAGEKVLKSLNKDKMSQEAILKAVDKNTKKKK